MPSDLRPRDHALRKAQSDLRYHPLVVTEVYLALIR